MNQSVSQFRLLGLEASPYTMKVESFLKFKGIQYEWINRSLKNEKLFQKHAKVQLIPLLFFPTGETMQDSTLIIERLEKEYSNSTIHPEDDTLRFLSYLFEEFGDEWCNKLMFFQRWFYESDAIATGRRLAKDRLEGQWWAPAVRPIAARLLVRRMVPRLAYSGGNSVNIPQLKKSFTNLATLLNKHFEFRPYLLGGRPSFGDFGLWCNFYEAWTDPTANAYLESNTPALVGYIKRMLSPTIQGEFETIETLRSTLAPIMADEIAGRFLPWMDANQRAWQAGKENTSLIMNGEKFTQKTFKYQAMTLNELRKKYNSNSNIEALNELLHETNCLRFLNPPETSI